MILNNMKKLISIIALSSGILLNVQHAKADWDKYAIENSTQVLLKENPGSGPDWFSAVTKVYKVDSTSSSKTLINTFQHCANYAEYVSNSWKCSQFSSNSFSEYDSKNGKIKILAKDNEEKQFVYDLETNTWTTDDASNYVHTFNKALIREKTDGAIHIGENSAVFKEENGREKFWAQDANGKSIPIDITNGSKLLINGRDVEQSINNVGALSAALTGLPTVPHDTTLACGLGTGTHGGDFAFSGGCASKVNEKLSINYAASMTMPGQDYAGDFEDSFSARAGFVWKLGKSLKPTQISMGEKEKMEVKIDSLEDKNKKLENTVSTLVAKLERLEKIAISETKSKDLATIKLP